MDDCRAICPDSERNEAARRVSCLVSRWGEGWNAHDMDALALLLTADVAFVSVAGKRLVGREEFRRHHEAIHQSQMRDTTWRTLGWDWSPLPGAQLLVHVEWMIEGERDANGLPRARRLGVFTWLVVTTDEGCRMRAAHNTDMRAGTYHRTEGGIRARLEFEREQP